MINEQLSNTKLNLNNKDNVKDRMRWIAKDY